MYLPTNVPGHVHSASYVSMSVCTGYAQLAPIGDPGRAALCMSQPASDSQCTQIIHCIYARIHACRRNVFVKLPLGGTVYISRSPRQLSWLSVIQPTTWHILSLLR